LSGQNQKGEIKAEIGSWAKVIRAANIKQD